MIEYMGTLDTRVLSITLLIYYGQMWSVKKIKKKIFIFENLIFLIIF